jgi:hypothetical protein
MADGALPIRCTPARSARVWACGVQASELSTMARPPNEARDLIVDSKKALICPLLRSRREPALYFEFVLWVLCIRQNLPPSFRPVVAGALE